MTALAYPPDVSEDARPYEPHGAALKLFMDQSREVVLEGVADSGKSRAALEKMHLYCESYPGIRCLMTRHTRTELTESAMVTFEQKVLPVGHPLLARNIERKNRHSYVYPNGSEVVCAGMDDPNKVYSTEYDMAYWQECREGSEEEWEQLMVRTRNGKLPFQQLMGDTNPDVPQHWLLGRAKRGPMHMYQSTFADNPSITEDRLNALRSLTGLRYKRLYLGLWCAAEGMIYEDVWNREATCVPKIEIPPAWPRYLSVDFGYTHPFVCQWWAADPDGRLHRYREIYRTRRLVSDLALDIRAASAGEPRPIAIFCDHDAEDRATLDRFLNSYDGPARREYQDRTGKPMPPPLGILTRMARKDVHAGIQAVANRMKVQPDGKPRLLLHQDSLVERDMELVDAHRASCTEEEIEGYIWNDRVRKEEPVKDQDDGCDTTRYVCASLDLNPRRRVLTLKTQGGGQGKPVLGTEGSIRARVRQLRMVRR